MEGGARKRGREGGQNLRTRAAIRKGGEEGARGVRASARAARTMLSATGRAKRPTLRNPAPTICVTAAERVQNCGGPGKNPKNLATTFAENPSTFSILSMPWCTMSAQVPTRIAVRLRSIAPCPSTSPKPRSESSIDDAETVVRPRGCCSCAERIPCFVTL